MTHILIHQLATQTGPQKLTPFLVRKNPQKWPSNPLSFLPQIHNIRQGSARDAPKRKVTVNVSQLPKSPHIEGTK